MNSQPHKVAAFFDMDRTVVLCNTGRVYFDDMRARGQLKFREVLALSAILVRYKFSMIDMGRVMGQAAKQLAGEPEQHMVDRCQSLFDQEVVPQISQAAVEAIEGHRHLGHRIALLSASTNYMVEPLCRHLGIEDFICTRLGTNDGLFTGNVVEPMCFGAGKIHWARAYADEHSIDLDHSYFYTDSYSDLPMLNEVGFKRVVNPDPRLRIHAAIHKWPILHFKR